MENTGSPPPYPGPPLAREERRIGRQATPINLPGRRQELEATYSYKHLLLATAAPGLPTTIYYWEWAEDGELRLSSIPTRRGPDSLRLVEGVQEVGFCLAPPKTAANAGKAHQDWVAHRIETLLTEAAKQGLGRTQPTHFTTASSDSVDVIAWIQKHCLSSHEQPHPSTTTLVRVLAFPVFSRSPSSLIVGHGPRLVWGFLKPTSPDQEGGGWRLELEDLLLGAELGAEWDSGKYATRLLVAGVSDEAYDAMIRGESWPAGIV
jgi:hypothetical protein